MPIIQHVFYQGGLGGVFSFLLRQTSTNKWFVIKSLNTRGLNELPIAAMQEIDTVSEFSTNLVMLSAVAGTSNFKAVIGEDSTFRFYSGTYPSSVSLSVVDQPNDFEANFTNSSETFQGSWVEDGPWGQIYYSFASGTFNDFQFQSFDSSGVVAVDTGDEPETSSQPNPAQSFVLPTVNLPEGQSTVSFDRRIWSKPDVSQSLFSLSTGQQFYCNGSSILPLTNNSGFAAGGDARFVNWQGNTIYWSRLFQGDTGQVRVIELDTDTTTLSATTTVDVNIPVAPSGYVVFSCKCEALE